jgi:hypothetical protein
MRQCEREKKIEREDGRERGSGANGIEEYIYKFIPAKVQRSAVESSGYSYK